MARPTCPSRTASKPLEISGRAVTAARIVAPKTTPFMPKSPASWFPVLSSITPATSVKAEASPNTPTTNFVDEFLKRFGASRPAGSGASPAITQARRRRARLRPMMPRRKKTAIAIEAGLTEPTAVVSGRYPPMSAIVTSPRTSIDSSSGLASAASEVSGCLRREVASRNTSTSVCIAMPPRRFPTASERWPLRAADAVMASSGSEPARPRRSMPPTASPRLKRSSRTSVAFER